MGETLNGLSTYVNIVDFKNLEINVDIAMEDRFRMWLSVTHACDFY